MKIGLSNTHDTMGYSFPRIYWIKILVACQTSRVSDFKYDKLYYIDVMIILYLKKRKTATTIRMTTNTAVPTIPAISPTSLSSFTCIPVLGEKDICNIFYIYILSETLTVTLSQ